MEPDIMHNVCSKQYVWYANLVGLLQVINIFAALVKKTQEISEFNVWTASLDFHGPSWSEIKKYSS
jgi:hypothetical protein